MSHDLTIGADGVAEIAFAGSKNDVWHRLGHERMDGKPISEWRQRAGIAFKVTKAPLFVEWNGQKIEVPNVKGLQRTDNGFVLGTGSDIYQIHQPDDVADFFEHYIAQDDRFAIDVMGSLQGGRKIWATAVFKPKLEIAGLRHVIRLLMTTTFDASGATVNKLTDTRVVCANTMAVALSGDHRAEVKTRHNTRFNRDRVCAELEGMAQSVDRYKAFGDAMAEQRMVKETVSKYFKKLLDIPFDAKSDEVTTRKMNQFSDLNRCYGQTVQEGTEPETAWAALNAVTRYVDHSKSSRGGNPDEARFVSAQFGTGAAMKAKAVHLLTADEEFKELLARPFVASMSSGRNDSDVAALLARPFRS